MKIKFHLPVSLALFATILFTSSAYSQIGRRFPSECKVVKDPVTGTMLTFLTYSVVAIIIFK